MIIKDIKPQPDWTLIVTADDGREGLFDVNPFLADEAFEEMKDISSFMMVYNRGYFIEWECGTDLSADTIESRMKIIPHGVKTAL